MQPSSTPAELIELSGPDAGAFAQAQFCNDVAALGVGDSQLNAWLNPQGRVRRLFHLLHCDENRYLLLLRGGDAASAIPTLRMFVLRLKVQVQALAGWHWGETDSPAAAADALRLSLPGERSLLLAETAFATDVSRQQSLGRDIQAGLPWLPVHALEQLLPSWMEFSRLGAISHNKGCYPGQEIVARLHFRGGGDKRRPLLLAGSGGLDGAAALRDDGGAEAGLLLQWIQEDNGSSLALAVARRELDSPGTLLGCELPQMLKVVQKPW